MKIDWKSKLTSRKFWAAVLGFVVAVMIILNVDPLTQQQVIGLIGAISILVAYIIGEGMVDAASASNVLTLEEYKEEEE